MWEYLLSHYYGCIHSVDYHTLTDEVMDHSEYDALVRAFSSNDTICNYVFRLNPYEDHLYGELFIRDLVLHEEFVLAEKLIGMYLQNKTEENNVQNNLFSLLHLIIDSQDARWRITSEGIDFVFRWIPLVKSKTKRAQLEVSLVDLMECVENDAPKGSMPFSLFASEGGFKLLMEEKQKQMGKESIKTSGNFDQYMSQKELKRETVAELKTAQSEFNGLFDFDALQKMPRGTERPYWS